MTVTDREIEPFRELYAHPELTERFAESISGEVVEPTAETRDHIDIIAKCAAGLIERAKKEDEAKRQQRRVRGHIHTIVTKTITDPETASGEVDSIFAALVHHGNKLLEEGITR